MQDILYESCIFHPIYQNAGEEFLTELQNKFRADLLWCGVNNRAPSYFAVSANYPNLDVCCREVRLHSLEALYRVTHQNGETS